LQRAWPQRTIPLDAPFLMARVSGAVHLQSFGGNYVADNCDGDAAANSCTGSLDALRIFLDIC
jgi:hypothetical protein